ncbi:B3 domain-containing protein At2g24670-like [Lotus japonicus]|uniref:B3 domain-containing protein At2g24670-like n=1 Tax=Lotus japonicus TaxID=34305 RepID=UPI002588EF35|nr:B3 domain-containing protein At2g24670-like [Lotus japonicus]
MRDKKEVWKLVKSVSNYETRQMLSSKPFKPGFLDMVLSEDSEHAAQFYSEEELTQIKKLKSQLGLGGGTSKTVEKNQNQRVIRESDDQETYSHSHSHSQVEATKAKNNLRVNRKRPRIPIQEMVLDDEEEDEAVLAKPAKKKSRKKIASENVQELPLEIRNRIAELNGTNTQFLMSKKLYNTDVKANNNRLSMPENSIKCEFRELSLQGVEVTVLDPCLREHPLVLKKWKMNSVFVYNLIKNWNKVVSENHFQKDHELQIWSFKILKFINPIL